MHVQTVADESADDTTVPRAVRTLFNTMGEVDRQRDILLDTLRSISMQIVLQNIPYRSVLYLFLSL